MSRLFPMMKKHLLNLKALDDAIDRGDLLEAVGQLRMDLQYNIDVLERRIATLES